MGIGSYHLGSTAQVMAGSADYSEYKTTGPERFVPEQADAIKVYDVRWSAHVNFVRDLIGYSQLGISGINRVTPQAHPVLTHLYATEATVEPIGKPQAGGAFDLARVTTVYRFLDYDIDQDMTGTGTVNELYRYCTRLYSINAEYLTTNRYLTWNTQPAGLGADRNVNPTERAGFIEPKIEKTIIWHEVPDALSGHNVINYDTIQSCLGYVNQETFDGDQPGTVLFVGVIPHKRAPKVGTDLPYWDIEYKFLIKDIGGTGTIGHNKLWNPNIGSYDLVKDRFDNHIYDATDLNALFVLE